MSSRASSCLAASHDPISVRRALRSSAGGCGGCPPARPRRTAWRDPPAPFPSAPARLEVGQASGRAPERDGGPLPLLEEPFSLLFLTFAERGFIFLKRSRRGTQVTAVVMNGRTAASHATVVIYATHKFERVASSLSSPQPANVYPLHYDCDTRLHKQSSNFQSNLGKAL